MSKHFLIFFFLLSTFTFADERSDLEAKLRPALEAAQTAENPELRVNRILDELVINQADGGKLHLRLLVDIDGNIKVRQTTRIEQRTVAESVELLGQELVQSGTLSLESVIPRGEVASAALRFTKESTRTHIVITWSLNHKFEAAYYNLYVINENLRTNEVSITRKEPTLNRELEIVTPLRFEKEGETYILEFGRARVGRDWVACGA